MGIAHGAFCVGCCWSLMLVMFGVGLGSLAADARARGAHGGREERAWGRRLSRPLGIVLILAAVYAVARERRVVCSAGRGRRDRDAARRPAPSVADQATADTRASILAAARACLLAEGYANLSTRRVAEAAGVPLSQIHYHFGSKQQLILAVLEAENERLLERQRRDVRAAPSRCGASGSGPATSSTRTSSRATSGSSRR